MSYVDCGSCVHFLKDLSEDPCSFCVSYSEWKDITETNISSSLTLIDKIRADIESAKEEVWELYGHELGLDRILAYDRCLEILDKYDERKEKE